MSTFSINLDQTIFYLSDALNLVGGNKIDHGKRVAFMAAECANALGWRSGEVEDLFLAALLHDCGISKTTIYQRQVNLEGVNAGNHCSRGAKLIEQSSVLAHLAEFILHHHVSWDELRGIDLPDKVKISANCINMLDTIDFLTVNYQRDEPNILSIKDRIRKKILRESDRAFHPLLVDIFMRISKSDAFWLALESGYNSGYAKSWLDKKESRDIDFEDLKNIVLIYSRMVDAKSLYTAQHSNAVAKLSRYLGELFGMSEHVCDKLELAGLLHDLGKLRIADGVLDKLGRLNEAEFLIVKRHSYDTYDILNRIQGFEDIALWASQHHERLDGSGYPFQCVGPDLPLQSRIIAVADIFQSCSQDRPQRHKYAPEIITGILRQMAHDNKLDQNVVLMLENHLGHCWQLANIAF